MKSVNYIMKYAILILLQWAFIFQTQSQNYSFSKSDIILEAGINQQNKFTYAVSYKKKPVILPSALGFELVKPSLILESFSLLSVDTSDFNEIWNPVWGEYASIRNDYKEVKFHLQDKQNSGILLNIVFRIFHDGVGFRYEFPEQNSLHHFIVKEENTHFTLNGNHKAFWIPGDFDTNEYLYNNTRLSEIDAFTAAAKEKDIAVQSLYSQHAVQTPLMMKSDDGLYINIHEAALIDYPAMQLEMNMTTNSFRSILVPDAVGNKAYLQTSFKSPWRTVIISDKPTEILQSTTILNLNDKPEFSTDWIKPQKFMGVWWEMHINKATWPLQGGRHGANTENVKKYIDFAAAHHFDGVLVEGWNEGWEDWFGNWKENVFDFVTPYADYDLNALSTYSKSKGIQLIMHHETSGSVVNYERRMDTAFRFMVNHNITTIKTGYVGKIIPRGEHHDGQWMINHYNRVAEKASTFHIMVDAHEPVRPTGLHRKYPNWMASEAARGAEFNNAPTLGITPEHNTILPFTRMMGGPMDFTPGLFHFQLNQFDSSRTQKVRTTLSKQLALYITMYSPLQMAADLPENYEKHLDAFQFIKDVPVDWSDTKYLNAEPGDFITVARKDKHSNNWFIGTITDENSRFIEVKLDFLQAGKKYQATIYKDGKDADFEKNPESYLIEKKSVDNKTTLKLMLAPGGGSAISIIELK